MAPGGRGSIDLINQPSGDLIAGKVIEVLDEMVQWIEHATVAMAQPGVHGLNVTELRKANDHLIAIRRLMGTTSTKRPDADQSLWPEGEGIDH